MFDGSLTTLEEVVGHYIAGGTQHPNQDPRIQPREVSAQDRADLVAFLNALSDEAFVTWAAGLRP
jgi:cytochrome c peroxidase